MPTKTKPKTRIRSTADEARSIRENQRKELARAVKLEKTIQRLTAKLDREMQRTNDRLQKFAFVLASYKRLAAEPHAERDK